MANETITEEQQARNAEEFLQEIASGGIDPSAYIIVLKGAAQDALKVCLAFENYTPKGLDSLPGDFVREQRTLLLKNLLIIDAIAKRMDGL